MATKKSYESNNGVLTEQTFGSIPAVEWSDENGNTFRSFPLFMMFDSINENYSIRVQRQIKPNGLITWINDGKYLLAADKTRYRNLTTGLIALPEEALDEEGNIKEGYCTNAKFFTIMLGYNPYELPVSLFQFVYTEIAEEENQTFE